MTVVRVEMTNLLFHILFICSNHLFLLEEEEEEEEEEEGRRRR